MAEVVVTRRFRHWCLFLSLAFLVIFARLLPLDAGPGRLPGPDLLVCLTFAWVLRRPAYVPVAMIAAVMLMTDILFLRPLGLWAFCVVLASECFARVMHYEDTLILAIFVVDQPSIGLTLIQMIATILAYPLVVLFSARIVGLKKAPPGAVDNLGRKL